MENHNEINFDDIYSNRNLEEIPWIHSEPPTVLVDLVENNIIEPCNAVDLGCGIGNYSIYLASKGFQVTGIDISKVATQFAKKQAIDQKLNINFMSANLSEALPSHIGPFSFAFEWELLHHIFPEQREAYVKNVSMLLENNAKYLSVCFHEDDPNFGGKGKLRKTPINTVLYFSSHNELEKLFSRYFSIIALKSIELPGAPYPHVANYVLMEKI